MSTTTQALARQDFDAGEIMERVITAGDLKSLTPLDRTRYYNETCRSIGLNPLTRPFEYITLNGKLTLYARKDATDQLRKIYGVSVEIVSRETHGDIYVVTARATMPDGRADESTGAVSIKGKQGDDLCNAYMKAETKAKRRVTLSVCGLGFLDESETETVAGARRVSVREDGVIEQPRAAGGEAERLARFRNRCHTLRREILDEGSENASVLDEKLGTFGCTSIDELTLEQATEYGTWLRAIHEEFVSRAVEGAVEDGPAF